MDGRPVRSVNGTYLFADLTDPTNRFAIIGYPDDRVADFVAGLRPGDCFVDVGANQGAFSILAASRTGPSGLVIAFEPQLELAGRIQRNAKLNNVDVVCLPIALSEDRGFLRLALRNPNHSGSATISSQGELVSSGPFPNELLADIGERKVFVKIDCEGYEVGVLKGLEPLFGGASVEAVVIEIDAKLQARFGHTPKDVYDRMQTLGFEPTISSGEPHFDEVFIKSRT
jgi:FkbM family methyltransferase